jgi:hypothetical protein
MTAALATALLAGGSTLAAAAATRGTAPSGRFDVVRFANVTHAPRAIVATLGIGVDIVGTVRDARGTITFSQHVVPRGPGIGFRRLSAPDRASLAKPLRTFVASHPHASPLWRQLLRDLSR